MTRSDKKPKLDVPAAGTGPALEHNPFAALGGATAPSAASPPAETAVPTAEPSPRAKSRGRLVLRRERKQRGGKTVVVVAGGAGSGYQEN